MKHRIYALVALIVLAAPAGPAAAQDFARGLEAAQRGDYDIALGEWRPLAERGDAYSQYNLGVMYDHGVGVPQDYAEAMKWYRLAAGQGNADARSNLGVMYAVGKGVPRDDAEAVKWYRLAAEQGNVNAQSNLGVVFYTGDGVPRDYTQALMWLDLAASTGHESAARNRDIVAKGMSAEEIAEAQRRARAWQEAYLHAPAAESPAEQSLAAQSSGPASPGPASPKPASPVRPAPQLAATPSASPSAAPAASRRAAASVRAWRIQLASLASEPGARKELERLRKTHADLIGSLGLVVRKASLPKGTYYRIQTGTLADRTAARALCGALKTRNQACLSISS